jgi:hypothetical protein
MDMDFRSYLGRIWKHLLVALPWLTSLRTFLRRINFRSYFDRTWKYLLVALPWLTSVRAFLRSISFRSYFDRAWKYLLIALPWLWVLPRFLLKSALFFVSVFLTVALAVVLVEVLCITPRNIAYRYLAPTVADQPANSCDKQWSNPRLLATHKNNEAEAQLATKGAAGLECMLQYHEVPPDPNSSTWYNSDKPIGPISYYLSFVEFQESGRLAEKGFDGSVLEASQLEVLEEHLSRQKNNYVLVFIHGWRRDARIGDENVANARVYAAYTASALDYRCKTTGRYCDYTVTAVFVGWRGARVDERAIEAFADRYLGFLGSAVSGTFKAVVGNFPAMLTLFDRKPISEKIAPSVVASLRHIDGLLKRHNSETADRLIVIGHSLGGNILASGLNSAFIDQIRNHKRGEILHSPLGDLVVLLNPAAEARKWTSLQHEMRLAVHFPENTIYPDKQDKIDLDYYAANQPPIYVSITSAFSWPSATLTQLERRRLSQPDNNELEETKLLAEYDAATHDAFPFFKGNFQPISATLERVAAWFPNSNPRDSTFFPAKTICPTWRIFEAACVKAIVGSLRAVAAAVRNVPFTNADSDETLTIGHLDPVRPPYGNYESINWQSPLPYGTTGEVVVNETFKAPTLYTNAGSADLSECAIVDHWLWKARHNPSLKRFEGWDSGFSHTRDENGPVVPDSDTPNVTPIHPRPTAKDHLEIQFRQYLLNSGTESIITANDPMWNLRAYETALAFHGGYVTYPLICALNQLVMDDIASEPKN